MKFCNDDQGLYSPKVLSGSEPFDNPNASLTLAFSHLVFLRIPAKPVTSPPQTSMLQVMQLQQPSTGETHARAQEQRQYLIPFEQYGMASETLPIEVVWQMGAQTRQQQCPHSRLARQQASQAAHWSMHMATSQAQLLQHRQVNTFWQVFIKSYKQNYIRHIPLAFKQGCEKEEELIRRKCCSKIKKDTV